MMEKALIVLLLVTSIVVAPPPSNSSEDYCRASSSDPSRCLTMYDAFSRKAGEAGVSMLASSAATWDSIVWLLARLSVNLENLAVNGAWYDMLRLALIEGMRNLMPSVIEEVAFGPTGLMYLALSLAGLVMILPFVLGTGSRLVRPERAIMWGVIMTALFISGSAGYDLIGYIDRVRMSLVQTALGGDHSAAVITLVSAPMLATPEEATDLDSGRMLFNPEAFKTRYFPEPQREEYTVKEVLSWTTTTNMEFESDASRLLRSQLALQSVLVSFLSLGAVYVVAAFAIAHILLGVAAMVLTVFFVAAMPLGFFEFGSNILMGLVERYVQVVALELALAVILRLMSGMMSAMPAPGGGAQMVEWIAMLAAMGFSVNILAGGAYNVVKGSFTSFVTGVRGAVAGAPPVGSPGLGQQVAGVARVAGGAILGAATGGAPGALLGASGGLLSELGRSPGSTQPDAASPSLGGPRGDVFVNGGQLLGDSAAPVAADGPRLDASQAVDEPLYRSGASQAAAEAIKNLD